MHPKDLSISQFTYHLPDERIARYPLEQRDLSKLLLYKSGQIAQTIFQSLPNELPADSLLVFNDSKVVEARLLFEKSTGGVIEIFALEPHEQYADITTAMNVCGSILYKCLVGGASKWKPGKVLEKTGMLDGTEVVIRASMVERRSDCFVVQFSWEPVAFSFVQILHLLGALPIPPYLRRQAESSDAERYQTLYARADGSVAAPTAGLHFTEAVLSSLQQKNILQSYVTLHVGAGTFKPVKSDTMLGHEMHAEFIEISIEFLEQLLRVDVVIPVGTTSMRTLESLYWMGVKTLLDPNVSLQQLEIKQWEVYDVLSAVEVSKSAALHSLIQWLRIQQLSRLIVKTQIIIAPGFTFKICKGLITNFHQPNSTLLLLVAALIGQNWKQVYEYALSNDFRFLSYGDSSLLLP